MKTHSLSSRDSENISQPSIQKKLTVHERLAMLVDPESFEEFDKLALSPFLTSAVAGDGVITGFATINSKKVAIYLQDFTIKGGSLGKRHAEKICKIMDLAAKVGCPIIGILDSGGARIDEGIHALDGYGNIFMRNVQYSGVIPQISVILGPCAGGAAYSPALTDIVFMTRSISQMFITGPQVIQQTTGELVDKETLGGADVHATMSGVAHVITHTEEECFDKLRWLLELLPPNYLTEPIMHQPEKNKNVDNLAALVPADKTKSYDMLEIINTLVDENTFFELHATFAPNIIVGFARLAGRTIGLIANQPLIKAGTLDSNASVKAARFINFCNAFDIPLISLVDVPGYLPGVQQEHDGIIRHGAKLLYAYAHAVVPKITVIIRKAFGGAYLAMCSRSLGADIVYAWPTAEIAVLGAAAAVPLLHKKALASATPGQERTTLQKQLESNYTEQFLNPKTATECGYVDALIDPNATRNHLIKALAITAEKVCSTTKKRSGNIPL